jgi:hypothetical protein
MTNCHKSREVIRVPSHVIHKQQKKKKCKRGCFAIAAVKMRTDSCVKCI